MRTSTTGQLYGRTAATGSGRCRVRLIQRFATFDGIGIAFDVLGAGPPVLLHHGFASSSAINWVRPKVAAAVAEAGRTVILVDARGHGESDKPHDPGAYANGAMARDVTALFDHLGCQSVDVVGYSMGSLVAMDLAGREARVSSLVLAGTPEPLPPGAAEEKARLIAEGLEAGDRRSISDRTALSFRHFAEATGADLRALAALQRSPRAAPGAEALGGITVPTLVLNGVADTLAGSPQWLIERVPGAVLRLVPGDHISAVMKPEFRREIVEFLSASR